MQLGPLVERRADRRLRGEPIARARRLVHRIGPVAVELHDLGAVNETLASVQDEIGLGIAPAAQRGRPLAHPSQIEQLMACLDDRAVRVADRDRRQLPCRDGHHRLVQQPHTLGDRTAVDQATADADPGQSHQLLITEPFTDVDRVGEP